VPHLIIFLEVRPVPLRIDGGNNVEILEEGGTTGCYPLRTEISIGWPTRYTWDISLRGWLEGE